MTSCKTEVDVGEKRRVCSKRQPAQQHLPACMAATSGFIICCDCCAFWPSVQLLTVSVWKVAPSTLTTSFHTLRKGSPMASSLEVLVETQRLSAMPEPCKLKSCIITEDCKFRFGSVDLGCSEALGEGGRCKLKRDRGTDTYNCILVCYRHMDGKMRL